MEPQKARLLTRFSQSHAFCSVHRDPAHQPPAADASANVEVGARNASRLVASAQFAAPGSALCMDLEVPAING